MTAASAAVTSVPSAIVSTPEHDQAWWAAEAVRAGSDWSGVVDTALEMLVDGGMLEQMSSWRQAAAEYHRNRPRRLTVEIESIRLERLSGLLADDGSLHRAWHDLRDNRTRQSF